MLLTPDGHVAERDRRANQPVAEADAKAAWRAIRRATLARRRARGA